MKISPYCTKISLRIFLIQLKYINELLILQIIGWSNKNKMLIFNYYSIGKQMWFLSRFRDILKRIFVQRLRRMKSALDDDIMAWIAVGGV